MFFRFLFNIKRKKTNKQHQELYLCSSVYFLSSWFFISFLQCSFQPDECKDNTEVRPNLPIGSTLQCFFNPEDTHQIVRIKASTESYNELLVSQVVWPLAIMMLGIVIIAAASCYYFSRNVNRYEELPGKSSATLLLTIWKIHQRMFTFCSRVIWHFFLGLYECFKGPPSSKTHCGRLFLFRISSLSKRVISRVFEKGCHLVLYSSACND